MAGAGPLPESVGESVLIYDRIAANKRETWLLMLLFVLIIGAMISVMAYALGAPLVVTPIAFGALSSIT